VDPEVLFWECMNFQKDSMQVSKQKMDVYKATASRRLKREQEQLALCYSQKWALAKRAARLLKEQFGAQRVVAFGSITQKELFHLCSDLDIAVWGLDEKKYYRAVAKLLEIDPAQRLDLIRIEDARDSLRSVINQEGILL
jgi:predicted nucleotidyltransferase